MTALSTNFAGFSQIPAGVQRFTFGVKQFSPHDGCEVMALALVPDFGAVIEGEVPTIFSKYLALKSRGIAIRTHKSNQKIAVFNFLCHFSLQPGRGLIA